MNGNGQQQLGKTLWAIADQLRGAMNADDFRDYMLAFLFLRYLSDNYESAVKKELGKDYPKASADGREVPLALWYAANKKDVADFEKQMRRKVHYVIKPEHLWASIANMARRQDTELLKTLQEGFKYIENESFQSTFQGLFLHGFHYLKDEGVMAIILPHGVLFRGGAEERIRTKLLKDGSIDTVIGLPANLFYSTGIPVCIVVLKKCKKPDDVLFINAAEHFAKGKRQNQLTEEHIGKIIDTYQHRKPEPRYSRRVGMEEIEQNDFNLNISRYVSTAEAEQEVDLEATHGDLVKIEKEIQAARDRHNKYLKELGLPPLP
jgi:type I restriction-modification system DNA methylase subunit